MALNYKDLKTAQRLNRAHYPENMALRVHRALSWLNRAEQCVDDLDAEFIFYWIAFNSAYSNEHNHQRGVTEQESFKNFLKLLCELDQDKIIYEFIWGEFANSIRVLLDNKFIYQPFWDCRNQLAEPDSWKSRFQQAKKNANRALASKQTSQVLAIIFSRLYTLRNQMLHGGSTWDSSVNRDQMRDSVTFLRKMIPVIIKIMMDNPRRFMGEPSYPVVKD